MSHSLGPIHYMMYEKIKYQDQITKYLLDSKLWEQLEEKMPAVIADRNLDDLIDTTNIHGWLASRIDVVESRLSYALANSEDTEEKLYHLGKQAASGKQFDTVEEFFQDLNGYLLDGMPCDHALQAGKDEEGNLLLLQSVDVHEEFENNPLLTDPTLSLSKTCDGNHDHDHHESFDVQDHQGIEIQSGTLTRYHYFRYQFLKGYTEESGFQVEPLGTTDFKISKK